MGVSFVRRRRHWESDAVEQASRCTGLAPALSSLRLTYRSSSAQEVDDQKHQPHNQEYVNQAATDVQTETKKPQDQ